MKKSKQLSTDGFIPRNHSKDQNSRIINSQKGSSDIGNDLKTVVMQSNPAKKSTGYGSSYFGSLSKDEPIIDKPKKKLSRRQRRLMAQKMANKPRRRLIFRIIKWLLIIILIAGLSFGAYTAYKIVSASNHVFQGNIIDILNNKPLKADKNGRSNFLIFGTAEDDPGHDSVYLTDSIMVVSVSQKNKDVYIFSVPRDLEVDYGGHCLSNRWRGKINEYYNCVNDVADDTENDAAAAEQERLLEMQKLVGDVFGMDIQYSVHVNYTVLKDIVDAVGGIDVYIEGSMGESGILDRNNDWRCNYECYYVKYDNGTHHLDGEHALYLALARGHEADINNRFSPTYGLSRSNPDREVNQQKILVALKEKAISSGTFANIGSVSYLIESLGNNLRTNIQMSEVGTILQIAQEIDTNNMVRIDMIEEGLINGYGNPSAGDFNYQYIQEYLAKTLSNNPVIKEEAPVVILNGTEKAGFAQEKKNELVELGYSISYIGDAPSGVYEKTRIYQIGTENTGTAEALSKLFGSEISTEKLPITVNGNVRFLVILGDDLVAE